MPPIVSGFFSDDLGFCSANKEWSSECLEGICWEFCAVVPARAGDRRSICRRELLDASDGQGRRECSMLGVSVSVIVERLA